MKRRGSTVVLITHRMNVLNAMDKLLVMRDGALAMYGPRNDVLNALYPKQIKAATQPEQHRNSGTDSNGPYPLATPLHAIGNGQTCHDPRSEERRLGKKWASTSSTP